MRVIYESKWWIDVDFGECRYYVCRSRNSRCRERHGWMIRKSQGTRSWSRGECYRRSSQLELVGVLRRVHGGEPCRLDDHVAARGLDHREGGEAEDKLDRTEIVRQDIAHTRLKRARVWRFTWQESRL